MKLFKKCIFHQIIIKLYIFIRKLFQKHHKLIIFANFITKVELNKLTKW